MALPQITGAGNLTADPELRYTTNGKAVASFTVASNEKSNNPAYEDKVFYARISAWGALAENIANDLSKGQYVSYSGKIEQRPYETNEGEKRTSIDVTAYQVAVPVPAFERDGSASQSPAPTRASSQQAAFNDDEEPPF